MNVGQEKRAFVTIMTNERYQEGCIVLYKSLQRVGAKYPFYVLMPTNIDPKSVRKLKETGINFLLSDNNQYQSYTDANNNRLYWRETVFKLEVFNLLQFDKIIFLDADMIVLKNIDSLFSKPHMSAVIAGKSCNPNWIGLNSGFMVIEPNVKDYVGLLACIDEAYKSRAELGYGFGDQDVIKTYFRNWPMIAYLHLEEKYNVILGSAGAMKAAGLIKSMDDISVYHFTGEQKPWSNRITDWFAILLKIIKRRGCLIDFQIVHYYRKCLIATRRIQRVV